MAERPVTAQGQASAETRQQPGEAGRKDDERKIAVYAGGTVSRRVEESRVYETDSHYDQDGRELFR